jgi:maltose/moltooligosaccharide transporter
MNKQKLSFWQIWNMSFGFLGIQFGFALQGGFMSRIFQTLGASSDEIPMLWIAAPLTGLIVQPIIGYLSDNTWHHRFGRRRPYFLIGAILSSITLFFIPYSSTLWIAAGLLWILDASINISMEPFRALVADKLDDTQRSYGFMVQTLVIGIGTWIASNLPWFISYIGFSDSAPIGVVPMSVKIAFAIGALVFLSSIIYTVFTTTEYPPKNIEEFKNKSKNSNFSKEIISNIISMPKTMKKLGIIQFFSWFAFFTMWSMSNPALTEHVYNSPMPIQSDFNLNTNDLEDLSSYDYANTKFQMASNSVGSAMGMYGLSSMLFALVLTFYTSKKKINRKHIHMFSLLIGGLGFIMMYFIKGQPELLKYCFVLIGISWGSILSMPYAMLSSSVDPEKMGITMGIFNMFIVIPQIIAAIGGINFVSNIIGDEPINSMIIAGLSLIIAGFANLLITNEKAIS